MKAYSLLIGACLIVVVTLSACDSGQSSSKAGAGTVLPYPTSQITPKAGAASPTPTTSGADNNAAPPFEVIAAKVKDLLGDARPVPNEKFQAAENYGRSLEGKTFKWQGWVEGVTPDKFEMEYLKELDTYTGTFWVSIAMDDPQTGEIIGSVNMAGLTRQQIEQFVQWYDPLKGPPYERAEFIGTIDAMSSFDDLMISVSASSITLVPGLATPPPRSTSTPKVVIQGNENPAPPFEEISATMRSIVASTPHGSQQQAYALRDYSQTLWGKTLRWEGWIYAVDPSKPYMQQHNELDTYDGAFGLWTSMYDLNASPNMTASTEIALYGISRLQVEQFTLWHDPTKYPPFQKIRFTGTIDILGYDSARDRYEIDVKASTVTLLK